MGKQITSRPTGIASRLVSAARAALQTLKRILKPEGSPEEPHKLSWLGTKGHARHQLGWRAEEFAARQLARLGYHLKGRNVPAGEGELDIVAEHRGRLAFIEVRARTIGSVMRPADSVRITKQRRVIACAAAYMRDRHHDPKRVKPRYDIAEVWMNKDGQPCEFNIVEDAFRDRPPRRRRDARAHTPGLRSGRGASRGKWTSTGGGRGH